MNASLSDYDILRPFSFSVQVTVKRTFRSFFFVNAGLAQVHPDIFLINFWNLLPDGGEFLIYLSWWSYFCLFIASYNTTCCPPLCVNFIFMTEHKLEIKMFLHIANVLNKIVSW